jgi:hypothetical protein
MKTVAEAAAPRGFVAAVRVQLVSEPTPATDRWLAIGENVAGVAWQLIGRADREHLVAFFVDSQLRTVASHLVGIGTATESLCDVAGLFRAALLASAHGIILVHNHPAGSSSFSQPDRALWEQIRQAGALLGIKVHDFIIVTPDPTTWCSIKGESEAGLQAERDREREEWRQKRLARRERANRTVEERLAFAVAVAEGKAGPGDLVEFPEGSVTLRRLAKRLYAATAALPDPARQVLGLRTGATYAVAARRLLREWKASASRSTVAT